MVRALVRALAAISDVDTRLSSGKINQIKISACNVLKSVPGPKFHGDSGSVLRLDSRLREHTEF